MKRWHKISLKLSFRKKRWEQLLEYYGDHMGELIYVQKYKEIGNLLLANAKPGEYVWLIGVSLQVNEWFAEPLLVRVMDVSFQGNNDASVQVLDENTANNFWLKNSDFGILFFSTKEEAEKMMERQEKYMARRNKYFIVLEGTDRAIIRSDLQRAIEKKHELEKRFPERRISIYVTGDQL